MWILQEKKIKELHFVCMHMIFNCAFSHNYVNLVASFLLCEDKCGRDGMICINKKNETWRKTNEKRFLNLYQKFNVLEILHGHEGNELMENKNSYCC